MNFRRASLPAALAVLALSPLSLADVSLTPLPTTGSSGHPGYKHINSAGMLAGESSTYRAFCWAADSGMISIHPSGPGVPTLAGTWAEDVNALGQVLGTGCIPPPSGNGACGTYVFRAEPNGVKTHLDFTTLGGTFALPGFLSDIKFNDRGSVAGEFRSSSSWTTQVVVFTDTAGWLNLSALFTGSTFVELVDINNNDQVLLQRGSVMYLWSAATGAVQVNAPGVAYGRALNDSGVITGIFASPEGNAAFRTGPQIGWQTLGSVQQFPYASPLRINNAGMIVGSYNGGTFLYTEQTGMVDIGMPQSIVGFNARGDVMSMQHDPTTYAGIPKIKQFGKPAMLVQDLIDPGHTKINVTAVSAMNDAGAFAAMGTTPGTQFSTIAFLATPSCTADFDHSGTVAVTDIFGFLTAWFASDMRADVDESGSIAVKDVFDFLTAWFQGC